MDFLSNFSGEILAGVAPALSDIKGFSPARERGLINPGERAVNNNGDILQHDFFKESLPNIIDFILQFSAGVAVLMIVVGGVMIMFAGEDEEMKTRGIKTLTWSIAGLIISVLSYTIVEIVNRIPITKGNPETDIYINDGHGIDNLASGDLLTEIIPSVIKIILKVVGMLALGLLLYAGSLMVMRNSDDEKITKSRQLMLYAVLGIVVSVLAYAIVESVLLINFTT